LSSFAGLEYISPPSAGTDLAKIIRQQVDEAIVMIYQAAPVARAGGIRL